MAHEFNSFHGNIYVRDKIKVSPFTGMTMQPSLPLKLVHRGFTTRIDIDMNILAMVLDHGHDDSEGFDSAEFVLFNHSQRISVVTRDYFRLRCFRRNTSNQYTPIQHSEARDHPRQRSRKTLRRGEVTNLLNRILAKETCGSTEGKRTITLLRPR